MSILDAVRRPEHTGDRRCWPCTAVNAAAVVLAAGVLSVVSPPVGLAALVVGATLVYLRGYVVPGTPAFAPRLVAALGLEPLFPHADDDGGTRRSDDLTADEADGDELLGALFGAGVVEEAADGGLDLSADFRARWEREMAELRRLSDDELAAAVADVAPFEAEGEPAYGGLSVEGPTRSVWLSRVQGIADAAAICALADAGVPSDLRANATVPLRMFTRRCPACGGDVIETTTTECCGGSGSVFETPTDDVLACADCGEIIYQFDEVDAAEEANEPA
jgi:hypothetical protein